MRKISWRMMIAVINPGSIRTGYSAHYTLLEMPECFQLVCSSTNICRPMLHCTRHAHIPACHLMVSQVQISRDISMRRKFEPLQVILRYNLLQFRSPCSHLWHWYSPLFLQLLVFLAREETSDPWLEPGKDLGQTVVTEFLHLTQDTSAEEDLWWVFNG
jgi:hypothetical protein